MDSSVGGSVGLLGVSMQPVTWRRLVSERVAVRMTCRGAWSSLACGGETGRLLAGDGMINLHPREGLMFLLQNT